MMLRNRSTGSWIKLVDVNLMKRRHAAIIS